MGRARQQPQLIQGEMTHDVSNVFMDAPKPINEYSLDNRCVLPQQALIRVR
jgi:hypothetical protein